MVDVQQQVWGGVLSKAPNGHAIQATYQHASTRAFQHAVGSCILAAAQVVPDGLLVFTPSYSMLDKLCAAFKVCSQCIAGKSRRMLDKSCLSFAAKDGQHWQWQGSC